MEKHEMPIGLGMALAQKSRSNAKIRNAERK